MDTEERPRTAVAGPWDIETCPSCHGTDLDVVDGISWCRPCELAFFPWTADDEADRVEDPNGLLEVGRVDDGTD